MNIVASDEPERFNFQQFLKDNGFNQYNKIKNALESNEITFDDILECND